MLSISNNLDLICFCTHLYVFVILFRRKVPANELREFEKSWTIITRQCSLTHLRRMDSSTTALRTGLLSTAECMVSFYYNCFIKIPVFNANIADPDQTQRSVASDLDSALFANYSNCEFPD